MKDKLLLLFAVNRKPIGYVIGGLNVLSGLSHLIRGDYLSALIWLLIGAVIIFDTWEFK